MDAQKNHIKYYKYFRNRDVLFCSVAPWIMLFFKPVNSQYTLFKKDDPFRPYACVHGRAFPCNDIGGVASLFHWLSRGGDRGSRTFFAGERGGGRNAPAAKSMK